MPYKRKGSPYWWVHLRPNDGSPAIRKSTKTTDYHEAKALEGRWRAELFKQTAWGESPHRTFAEVASQFLLASESKRTLSDIQWRVAKLYDFFGAELDMNELAGKDVRAYIEWRQKDRVKPATINRELDQLSAMINYCITELEWQLPNPVRGRSLKEPEAVVRWITRKEAAKLVAEARKLREGDRLADFIELGLHTGCRKNEMLLLTWRRVDFKHGLITLEGEDNKTGKRRTVPLNDVAMAALKRRLIWKEEHCPHTPWVFCKRDGSRLVAPREGFIKACKNAGIKNFRIHDLRHTCASWMVSEGVALADIKEVLGHSTITMTEKYAHLAPHRARSAVARLHAQSGDSERPEKGIEDLIGRRRRA